jgi:iron complex outermembrane recepter protein
MAALAIVPATARSADVVQLAPVVVTAPAESDESTDASLGATSIGEADLAAHQRAATDSAQLLRDIPGVSLHDAGGISSLPAIHGLADDRLRIRVDGVDLAAACPNHMNAPLSYVAPSKVDHVQVFTGLVPVSVGGDSIGGAIQVFSAVPVFAPPGERYLARAEVGSFYRSNGNAYGYNLSAAAAGRWLSLSYAESSAQSDDYVAGGEFKAASPGREGGPVLAGNVVGSSAFRGATNRSLGLAVRRGGHRVELDFGRQTVDFEGFPNQRMDMTWNDNWVFGLRYTGQVAWGDLEARLGYQYTRHRMDMGSDRFSYGTGMPMDSKAKNRTAAVQANSFLSEESVLRTGVEYQSYTLYDWWPAVGGVMGPNDFWNIDYGRRSRLGIFAEWEGRWRNTWTGQLGLRSDTVGTDAAAVQGYDNGLSGAWGDDAAGFNAKERGRNDYNWGMTGSLVYAPSPRQSYEAGYSRKSRSPNLYQRYAWSTNPMAALMNNLAGDGNGYVGNTSLAPEVAHTVSITGDWHDPAAARWSITTTGYYTYAQDYIDVRRCDVGQCSDANLTASTGFVLLQYVNQPARIWGWDLTAHLVLFASKHAGKLESNGSVAYVRGENLSTGDALYNLMPLHGRLAFAYRLGAWSLSPELLAVAHKNHVSVVRNEVETGAYWLVNLHSSLEWKHVRVDLAIENLLDRLYASPLGGAYLGQGPSMTTNGIPWGLGLPGRGRSFNLALGIRY